MIVPAWGVAQPVQAQAEAPTPVSPLSPTGGTQIGAGGDQGASADVDLRVLQYGLGNAARPGTWTGVQIQIQDFGVKSREIVVRLAVRDEDGDTAQYQSTVATNPGSKTTLWLYPRLTFRDSGSTNFLLTAHEARDGNAAEAAAGISRAGRQLARVQFQPGQARFVNPDLGMIGVIGRATAGLELYALPATNIAAWPAMAHERVLLVSSLGTSALPDRWLGLSAFNTLVWTGSGADAEPTDLVEQQARSLREWVQRGGHLVVILPPVGQAWTNPGQPLADIMPRVSISRDEAADLNAYRPWLTHKQVTLPSSTLVQSFGLVAGTRPEEAQRLITAQDGKTLAVRRVVGSGAVTLVGIDVSARALNAVGGVQAEAFWNRILGRRGRTPTSTEINELATKGSGESRTIHKFSSREEIAVDGTIAGMISRTGKAAIGVLLAFLIFAVYWLCAGPLGFFVLKRRERTHYAWLGFVAVGAGFTALAWTGAQALRPNKTSVQHFTVLDAVYGQGTHTARIFAAASLPSYGEQTFGIAGAGDSSSAGANPVVNAVASWESPPSEFGDSTSIFPDSRDYAVATRTPDRVRVPTRGTVKNFTLDWLGGSVLKTPLPVAPDSTAGQPARIAPLAVGLPADGVGWEVQGALQHELPAKLKDVTIIAVRGQSRIAPSGTYQGMLQAVARVRQVSEWAPGSLLILNDATKWADASEFIRNSMPRGSGTGLGMPRVRARADFESDMVMLSLATLLEPPDTLGLESPVQVVRREGHDLNLSRWFTQPCVIVMGYLDDVPCPVSLAVDGESVGSNGRVLVRWVYPLPEDPVVIPRPQ